MPISDSKVTLSFSDGTPSLKFPIYKGTIGPDVIDIQNFYKISGKFTYDPGFMSTASCNSAITYIDGNIGELLYRGYPIEQLATKCNFMEICYLLLYGELPNKMQNDKFIQAIAEHTMVDKKIFAFLNGFSRNAHPMAILTSLVSALPTFYEDYLYIHDPYYREISAIRIIAKLPTLIAMIYKFNLGQPFIYPSNNLKYCDNFIYMMFSNLHKKYKTNKIITKALDRILILHADHEQNASTSTVRLVGSSGANPFSCIAAGIACLWGPLHGGANEAVLNMLKKIDKTENISKFIKKIKNKSSNIKLMGFGHRIYKNYDPRAKIIRNICYKVLNELDLLNKSLFKLATKLEKIALEDDYFVSRKLYPNVDFYSGIIQQALGIPVSMFTCIFAMARSAGWVAQWNEMISDPNKKIGRPRQLFVGSKKRSINCK
ncbi:citrate synthase [Candidatus Profftella armatura]